MSPSFSLHVDDAVLMGLASGGEPSADQRAHLAGCAACASALATFAAVRDAARGAPVSPFASARAQRELERALDDDQRKQRRALRPSAVGALAVSSALVGALAFAAVTRPRPVPAPAPAPVPVVATAPVSAPPAPVGVARASEPEASPPVVAPVLAPVSPVDAPPRRVAPRVRVSADELLARGDGAGAARLLVAALGRGEPVESDLGLVLRRYPNAFTAIDADLARITTPEAQRLRCAQGLLHRRDRTTVEACRAFARAFPEDPAVRTLALAAGRVAEDDLGDLELAEEEYERALLLSPFSGLPSTDALFARARVRAKLGELDEARADLRLYLHQEPAARHEAHVQELMQALDIR
jgi:hypothetical protein